MHDFYDWLRGLNIYSIDDDLLLTAFTHKSFKGIGQDDEDNERLEFLGDAILDLITAEDLFYDEHLSESQMTELRKNYVSNDQLAVIFNYLDMEQFIRVAKNVKLSNRIKAGFVEAFFAVIYLEKGYDICHQLWELIQERLGTVEDSNKYKPNWDYWYRNDSFVQLKNSKTTLQEFCQSHQLGGPDYQVIKRTGPDHNPNYTVKLVIKTGSNKLGYERIFEKYALGKTHVSTFGKGKNKKLAQKRAAEEMCDIIGLMYSSDTYD